MLQLYARPESSNCQKVLWLVRELGVSVDIVPAGLRNVLNKNNPDYRRLTATGLVPLLVHDGQAVDESNTITRYLCQWRSGQGDAKAGALLGDASLLEQARVSRWMDYCFTLELFMRPVYFDEVRGVKSLNLEADKKAAIDAFAVIDTQLAGRQFLANERFTLADITCAAQIHRFFRLGHFAHRPAMPNLEAYYQRVLLGNPNFVELIANVAFV